MDHPRSSERGMESEARPPPRPSPQGGGRTRRSLQGERIRICSPKRGTEIIFKRRAAPLAVLIAVRLVAFIGDPASDPPPASGTYAYNAYGGPSAAGGSYVDPVFGETVRRLTTDHSHDDIYARKMLWSADETRYLHRSQAGGPDRWQVSDVATGSVEQGNIPFGYYAADGGFDPVDPNVLYYVVRDNGSGHGEIHKVTLSSPGTYPNCCSNAVSWT